MSVYCHFMNLIIQSHLSRILLHRILDHPKCLKSKTLIILKSFNLKWMEFHLKIFLKYQILKLLFLSNKYQILNRVTIFLILKDHNFQLQIRISHEIIYTLFMLTIQKFKSQILLLVLIKELNQQSKSITQT